MKNTFDILSAHKEAIKASFEPPKGYFDTLKSQVMTQLPPSGATEHVIAHPARPRRRYLLPKYVAGIAVAAACVAVVWIWPFAGSSVENIPNGNSVAATVASEEESNDKYIDDLYNYAMLDRYSYYDYILEDY